MTASVTNIFQNQSGSIPLSQLDTNFTDILGFSNNPYNRNNFAVDAGTTNSIQITLDAVPAAYTQGLEVSWKQLFTNTGAPTLNVNGLGAKNLVNQGGTAVGASGLSAGATYNAIYNGTAFYMITTPAGSSQSEVQTATTALSFVTPNVVKFAPGVAKASGWINGTATGTITGAFGTFYGATASNSGTGTYNIVFSTAMANTQFVVLAQPYHTSFSVPVETTRTTAGFTIITLTSATVAMAPVGISFSVFGTSA